MGKRSNFERRERDFYPTPEAAVVPLINYQKKGYYHKTFHEPCAGDGQLSKILQKHGYSCFGCHDIEPRGHNVAELDAFKITQCQADSFITNPPWNKKILHPLIEHLSAIGPTWLLLDAGWMHTKQSNPFMEYCHTIVSV